MIVDLQFMKIFTHPRAQFSFIHPAAELLLCHAKRHFRIYLLPWFVFKSMKAMPMEFRARSAHGLKLYRKISRLWRFPGDSGCAITALVRFRRFLGTAVIALASFSDPVRKVSSCSVGGRFHISRGYDNSWAPYKSSAPLGIFVRP